MAYDKMPYDKMPYGKKPKKGEPRQQDKADRARNLTNPYGYESNGFKKHRDQTPI